jgi:hypothetical protein
MNDMLNLVEELQRFLWVPNYKLVRFISRFEEVHDLITCDFPVPPIPPKYILIVQYCSEPGVAAWFATILKALSCSELSENF